MPDRSILYTHANAVGLVHTASTACSPGISAVDEVIRAGRVVDEVALMHWLLACSCLAVSCSQALLQARCASDVPPGRTAVSRDMIYHISQLLGLLLSVKLESACHCHRERAKCAVLCTELEGQESLLQVNLHAWPGPAAGLPEETDGIDFHSAKNPIPHLSASSTHYPPLTRATTLPTCRTVATRPYIESPDLDRSRPPGGELRDR